MLSKTDTRTIEIIKQHLDNANRAGAQRLADSFLRSSPSSKIETKRREALAAI